MTVISTLKDGGTISRESTNVVVASGLVYVQVVLADLETIDAVLNVQIAATNPKITVGDINHVDTSTNVVGFTLLAVGAGTTLTAEVVAVGY